MVFICIVLLLIEHATAVFPRRCILMFIMRVIYFVNYFFLNSVNSNIDREKMSNQLNGAKAPIADEMAKLYS